MMLECSVFIEDNSAPHRSFKRFVFCNLHVGLLQANHVSVNRQPYLCVVTSSRIFKYKIANIKCVRRKAVALGKITVEFSNPPHSVMVRCINGKLPTFLRLMWRISEDFKAGQLDKVPVIQADLKFVPKSDENETSSNLKLVVSYITCIPLKTEVLRNIHVLHLPNSNIKKIPVQLGLLPWSDVNLENNGLSNDNLLWLEELPVRKSLGSLNLSKNQITSFPSAVIDYYKLINLNLRDNHIQYIPGGIGSLQSLCYLNLSENKIRTLPASITLMKLEHLDLTRNYLTGNMPIKVIPQSRKCFKTVPRLEDLASLRIDSTHRRQLTIKDCPPRLLEKLRCSSCCICGKPSLPSAMTEYYVTLKAVKFSASYYINPQKTAMFSIPETVPIFLQYHFCTLSNHCESRKFKMINDFFFYLL